MTSEEKMQQYRERQAQIEYKPPGPGEKMGPDDDQIPF
jgi:hypothetical protein